jgi:Zn-dependent protease with chaperone function
VNASATTPIAGIYFDGRTSAERPVTLALDGHGVVHVAGDGVDRFEPWSGIRVSEPLGAAPRLFTFADEAFCEVPLQPGIEGFLARAGHADSPVVKAQSRWTWAIASALLLLLVLAAGYRFGLPWIAGEIAERIPAALVAKLSDRSLQFLDRAVFEPSKVAAVRREAIAGKFLRLTPPDGAPVAHEVLFRASGRMGANALALPSGTIIVTDELVALTADDDEILAVLTHELGHVQERHGLRLLVEGSIVGFALTWYLGDVSSLAASVPAALLQARFSREHERAADAYGARMLLANGLSPVLLATMLEKLERSHGAPGAASGRDPPSDYLSSHPATRERIETLRNAAPAARP